MKLFPKFWFEGNQFFSWIENLDDLHRLFEAYHGHLTPKGILDRATCVKKEVGEFRKERGMDRNEYGLRREHLGGTETLREFLSKHNIEFNF